MSIIHKALKRAEGATQNNNPPPTKISSFEESGNQKKTIIAAIVTLFLAVIFIGYLIKAKIYTKPRIKQPVQSQAETTPATLPSPAANASVPAAKIVSPKPDTLQLQNSAIEDIKAGNFPNAVKTLKKAIAVEPSNASIYNLLGLALKKQSKTADSIRAYEKALKLRPDYPEALNNLAVAFESTGQSTKAGRLYKKAISINPNYEQAHLNYALLLESVSKEKEARIHFEAFLNISKDELLKQMVRGRLKQ